MNLQEVLVKHKEWLAGNKEGVKADLSGADLRKANLREANLRGADLCGADLCGADLRGADLRGADLYGANLREVNLYGADLRKANLREVNLCGANLYGANLRKADLCGANLYGANLREADLCGANLYGANLRKANVEYTILDPNNVPSGADTSFEREGEYIIGYRTEKAGHIDIYRVGRYYSEDWFSTCETECHPGLYIWPTLKQAKQWAGNEVIIKVLTSVQDVHKAGTKYRTRWFKVIELLS